MRRCPLMLRSSATGRLRILDCARSGVISFFFSCYTCHSTSISFVALFFGWQRCVFGFFLRVTTPFASNDAVVFSVPFVASRLPCLRWCLQVSLVGHVGHFAVLAARFAFKHARPTLRSAKRLNKCAGSLPRLYLCGVVAFDVFDRSMPRGHVFSI